MSEDVTAPLKTNGPKNTSAEVLGSRPAVLTIEQLNLHIKQTLEGTLGQFWVQGEISNFKPHSSGHFYFSLKDAKSQISAVMFRGNNSRLRFKPHDGLEVIVRGRLGVYEPRGTYQVLCESMEPVGAGALQKAFEQLKDKLKKEGLFELSRKKPIPNYPKHLAVVTSPTGAAIRDILNILSRRAPNLQVTVVPTIVQGEASAQLIAEAIKQAQRIPDVDVIIVGRGGGSIEDMWGFNDEALARLIAASAIPIISAVGHEIDFTIADFVADLRAPTPSAAAELVAKSALEIQDKLNQLQRILILSMDQKLKTWLQTMHRLQKQLVDPKKRLQDLMLKHDDLNERLNQSIRRLVKTKFLLLQMRVQGLVLPKVLLAQNQEKLIRLQKNLATGVSSQLTKLATGLEMQMRSLHNLSPLNVVARGYSLVTLKGRVIRSQSELKNKDRIDIQLADGKVQAEIINK